MTIEGMISSRVPSTFVHALAVVEKAELIIRAITGTPTEASPVSSIVESIPRPTPVIF
jgi:hypothetical protein